jgi:outer membrane protein OmpA-like peptidoglycan-associated protein
MLRRGSVCALAFALLFFPAVLSAQPSETGETGLLTLPTTRTLKPRQISLGAFVRRDIESDKTFEQGSAGITDTDLVQGSFVAGFGLLHGIELSVQVPWIDFQVDQPLEENSFRDVGNVRISPKFRLFQEGESPMPFSFALLGSVAVPSGSDNFPAPLDRNSLFNKDVGWEVMGIVDKNLAMLPGEVPIVLTLNIGGLFPGEPDVFRLDRQTEPVFAQLRRKGFPKVKIEDAVVEYGAGLNLPLWKNHIGQLDQTVEFRGNTGTIDEIDSYRAILAGFRYMLVNGWAAQGGIDFGLSNSLDRYNVFAGLSWSGPQPPPPVPTREKVVYRDRVIQVEKIVFSDITFEFDKATLTDVGRGRVYLIAQKLKEGKNIKVEIQGHTDYIGTEEYNKTLGLKRAEAVKAELVKLGVDPSRMSTVSFGESKPLIDQPTPWARAVNRRVEFVVESETPRAEKTEGE